jgi:hypothetical protein
LLLGLIWEKEDFSHDQVIFFILMILILMFRKGYIDQHMSKPKNKWGVLNRIKHKFNVERINMEKMSVNFKNKQKLKISLFDKFLLISRYMYRMEGIWSFWRGIKPNMLRSGLSSGTYFYQLRLFESIFHKIRMSLNENSNLRLLMTDESIDFWGSGIARSTTGLILNPLTIIRTRAEIVGCSKFKSISGSFRKIYKKEGMRGYFKGGFLNIVEEFPFGGIFNLVYEEMNRNSGIRFKQRSNQKGSNMFRYFQKDKVQMLFNATIAAMIASTVTHPIEIAKTKIQSHKQDYKQGNQRSKVISIFKDTYRRFGFNGLFFGLWPRLIKKTFVNSTVFFLYEVFSQRTGQKH